MGDASAPDLPAASFDVVASSLVLFLPDPRAALARWVALLCPGGRIGVTTFGAQSALWRELDGLLRPWMPPLDPRSAGPDGPFASDAAMESALATAFATGRALGKTTIRVKDSASFVVNRLLGAFMGEFSRIVDEGTPVATADLAVAGLAPMPPFVLLGLVGPAIALHNSETLHRAFGDRFHVSPSLRRLVESGKRGYYLMEGGRPVPDPEVLGLLALSFAWLTIFASLVHYETNRLRSLVYQLVDVIVGIVHGGQGPFNTLQSAPPVLDRFARQRLAAPAARFQPDLKLFVLHSPPP